MGINIVSTYQRFAQGQGGTTGRRGDYLLNSSGDFVLQSKGGINKLLNSDGDFILQSPFTCFANMLNSDGDFVLQSGGTDKVQISGFCTSKMLESGDKVRATS